MKSINTRCAVASALIVCLLYASGVETETGIGPVKQEQGRQVPPPAAFVSEHSGKFNGEAVAYTVTAGETYLRDGDGEPKASIFSIAYIRNEDAQSIAEFICDWTTAHGRWNAPRFLLGESFGSTRAAAVANILESGMEMGLNGIIFISQALD
jgi:carboxypeptidase C (cathepsin A)